MPCILIKLDNVLTLYRMQTYTTIRFVGSDKNPVNVEGIYLSRQQNGHVHAKHSPAARFVQTSLIIKEILYK